MLGSSVGTLVMLGEQLGVVSRASSEADLADVIRRNLRWVLPVGPTALLVCEEGRWSEASAGERTTLGDSLAQVVSAGSSRTLGADAYPGCGGTEWWVQVLRDGDAILGLLLLSQSDRCRMEQDQQALLQFYVHGAAGALGKLLLLRRERRATHAAEEATRTRDRVLASVVHDLLNPVAGVRLTAEAMVDDEQDGVSEPDDRIRDLQAIVSRCDDMTEMIREMLDSARVQAGATVALRREPHDLLDLVRTVVDAVAVRTNQELRCELAPHPVVGRVDRARLRRVFANLLENASKYSPGPGVLEIRAGRVSDAFELSVQDYGIGVPAADLPHLFERFVRAGNVGDIPGTGVGLATAHEVVLQHGGSIEVTSTVGVGSRFTVRLPLDI